MLNIPARGLQLQSIFVVHTQSVPRNAAGVVMRPLKLEMALLTKRETCRRVSYSF